MAATAKCPAGRNSGVPRRQADAAIVHLNNSMELPAFGDGACFFIGAAQDRQGRPAASPSGHDARTAYGAPTCWERGCGCASIGLRQSSPITALSLAAKDPRARTPGAGGAIAPGALLFRRWETTTWPTRNWARSGRKHPEVVPGYYEVALKYLIKGQVESGASCAGRGSATRTRLDQLAGGSGAILQLPKARPTKPWNACGNRWSVSQVLGGTSNCWLKRSEAVARLRSRQGVL